MAKLGMGRAVCAIIVAAACATSLVGCGSGITLTGGVAATVNGVEIMEDDITTYIETNRSVDGLDDDESWAAYLATYGYTPETMRELIIDSFIQQEVIRQAAQQEGVEVDSATVDMYYNSTKANYTSEAEWKNALEDAGMTEASYRETIELSLLSQGLQDAVAPASEPTEAELIDYANTYASYYDGARRSSHILFDADDEATAQSVLQQINDGTMDFADAVAQYSMDTGSVAAGGDVGWDALTSFVTEYSTALSTLAEGQVSDLVVSDYGIHIIKCTEVFTAPSQVTSIDQIPADILASFSQALQSSTSSAAYEAWLTNFEQNADIVVNPAPEGLPYMIDMSAYESGSSEGDASGASAGSGADAGGSAEGSADGAAAE